MILFKVFQQVSYFFFFWGGVEVCVRVFVVPFEQHILVQSYINDTRTSSLYVTVTFLLLPLIEYLATSSKTSKIQYHNFALFGKQWNAVLHCHNSPMFYFQLFIPNFRKSKSWFTSFWFFFFKLNLNPCFARIRYENSICKYITWKKLLKLTEAVTREVL